MAEAWHGLAGVAPTVGGWTAATACLAIAVLAMAAGWRRRRRRRLLALTRKVTARHARLLSVKQKQLVSHDGYGNYQLDAWIEHVGYFIENVVLREARERHIDVRAASAGTSLRSAMTHALLQTLNGREQTAGPIADGDIISGEHYETLCRTLLQECGWRVDTTPVTGDQGADLIAEAAGRRVVIQCKFYARPVGNKAVQEAHAAMGYHAGNRAAVVSNASFTRSAKSLADANSVLLLHHDQLADLDRLITQAEGHG